jgi:hypothetical protein
MTTCGTIYYEGIGFLQCTPATLCRSCLVAEVERLRARVDPLKIDGAIGGRYIMPDGRDFWIDGPVANEITKRVVAQIGENP